MKFKTNSMQIHELTIRERRKRKKRVGRGGAHGKTSGRGQKGQRARAGHSVKPAERDLIQRIPKLRGSGNKKRNEPAIVIPVGMIEKLAENGKLTRAILLSKRVIKKIRRKVKIVSQGECMKPVIVEGIPASKTAKEKIEKAGGSVRT